MNNDGRRYLSRINHNFKWFLICVMLLWFCIWYTMCYANHNGEVRIKMYKLLLSNITWQFVLWLNEWSNDLVILIEKLCFDKNLLGRIVRILLHRNFIWTLILRARFNINEGSINLIQYFSHPIYTVVNMFLLSNTKLREIIQIVHQVHVKHCIILSIC